MNSQNLVPNSERTPSERKEIAQKGGKKSGEARAKRKTLRETMEAALQGKYNGELTAMQAGVKSTIKKWIDTGDISILNGIRDLIGEKPTDNVTIGSDIVSAIKIKFVDKSNKRTQAETDPKIIGDYTPPTNTE